MIIKADGVPLIFFIWLNMLVVLIYSTRSQLFFFQCSFIYYLSWNVFLRCDKTNLIYVIIQVEKTFRALHCQKCGKYLKKKKNHRNIQESTFFSFKLNISRFQAPVKHPKILGKSWSSIIASYLIKLLSSWPFHLNIFCCAKPSFCQKRNFIQHYTY